LLNAYQASPKSQITVRSRIESADRSLRIQVIDDGAGMDDRTLQHAMDPFFSSKPAGRQVGMGLPRAQQLAAAHGGKVDLRSTTGKGTTATLIIPLDSPQ
jgi:signal transduction histidine kinase